MNKRKIDFCYHCHTFRCGHAEGSDEQYVQAAILNGIKTLWFTDHVMLPGMIQPGIRGDYDKFFLDYVESIKNLKEKYKDIITIELGFECEYLPKYINYYKELKSKYGFVHLILGQHFYITENNEFDWYCHGPNIEQARHYVDDLVEGIKSGLFDFVCHPDLFLWNFSKFTPELEECSRRIFKTAEKYNVPLEINLHKLEFQRSLCQNLVYPDPTFWSIASEYNVKVTFNGDCHSPSHFFDTDFDFALDMIKKYNLRYVGHIE